MKLPFIRRSTHEAELREAAAGEARAIKRAISAEEALRIAFDVEVEEIFNAPVKTTRLQISDLVLRNYRGSKRDLAEMTARKLVQML